MENSESKTTSKSVVKLHIKSSQKIFTEDEVVNLTGICLDHLRGLEDQKNVRFSRFCGRATYSTRS